MKMSLLADSLLRSGLVDDAMPVLRTVEKLRQWRTGHEIHLTKQMQMQSKRESNGEGKENGEQQQQQRRQQHDQQEQEHQSMPKRVFRVNGVDIPQVRLQVHDGAPLTPPGLTANTATTAYPLVGLFEHQDSASRAWCRFFPLVPSTARLSFSLPFAQGWTASYYWRTGSLYINGHYMREVTCAIVTYRYNGIATFEENYSGPSHLCPTACLVPPRAPAPAPAPARTPRLPPTPKKYTSLSKRDPKKWVLDEFARRGLNKIVHCRSFEEQRRMHEAIIADASPLEREALKATLSFHRALLHRLPGEASIW